MSLINFPDVPNVPGVPNLRRAAIGAITQSGLTGKIYGANTFGIIDRLLAPEWAILDSNGRAIISPNSFVGFWYKGEQRIATHPVENGSFANYNKVALPFDIRVRMTCSGQGEMTRDQFLAQCDVMLKSIDLYNIATPDVTYANVNCEHVDYRRESKNGVTLLTVEMWFSEIRVTAKSAYTATAQPSGTANSILGQVRANAPTASQLAAHAAHAVQ